MLTNDEIYQTLDYKVWRCVHEIKEDLDTSGLISLEAELSTLYIQNQPDVILSQIEQYLTVAVDEKVVEARKRAVQNDQQIERCGLQKEELEYRLVPQEKKMRSGTEAGRSGEYRGGGVSVYQPLSLIHNFHKPLLNFFQPCVASSAIPAKKRRTLYY